ncbi:MAG TPA: glycine radical domain-containing protein [Syntrophomonadaceae bacterium]|nr:glycine radical domain-containing protein [Syntrophomonadaceae bacterium]
MYPRAGSGPSGRNNLINLIEVYFLQGGMHSQFNIISSAMMRDAFEKPHLYKG